MNGEPMNGAMPPEPQPGPQIRKSNKKTKRYSKRVIVMFILGLGLLIFFITAQATFKPNDSNNKALEKSYRTPQQAGFAELATSMRRDRRPIVVETAPPPAETPQKPQSIVIEERPAVQAVMPALPRYYSNKDDAQAANTLRTLRLQALTAPPVVENFAATGSAGAGSRSAPEAPSGAAASGGGMAVDSAAMAAMMQQQQGNPDQNGQQQKQSFLRASGGGGSFTPQGYSSNLPIPRQFPYELKAGTIIPGLLLTGVNSDLPGNVLAQVSENVWDVTGKYVLIPKGTRAIGVYDSQVTYGQQRVLLVWNRLVFPNGMTLDIAGSPGIDQAGYSGLSGRVNEHWGRMFKAALLSSVFVAGAEIVYSEDSGGDSDSDKKSPRDVAAESLAGSILDMGTKIMGRTSDIQPTITVKPGKKVGIFVQQDVAFPYPYM